LDPQAPDVLTLVGLDPEHCPEVVVPAGQQVIAKRDDDHDGPQEEQHLRAVRRGHDTGDGCAAQQHEGWRPQPRGDRFDHGLVSFSSMSNMASTVDPKNRAIRNASGNDGR
jgi:hypothetical protein